MAKRRLEFVRTGGNVSELGVEGWQLRCGELTPDCILDLRTEAQYARSRLVGAVSMPYNVFQAQAEEASQGFEVVLLVDEAGARAAEMAVWLRARGCEARYLVGGMAAWRGRLERP